MSRKRSHRWARRQVRRWREHYQRNPPSPREPRTDWQPPELERGRP